MSSVYFRSASLAPPDPITSVCGSIHIKCVATDPSSPLSSNIPTLHISHRAFLPGCQNIPVGRSTWRRTILLALALRLAILLLLLLRGLTVLLLLLLGRWGRAAGSCAGSTTCGLCGLEFRSETHYCDSLIW